MKKISLFSLAAICLTAFAGCSTTDNTNVGRTNANMNGNSNVAIVVNNNTADAMTTNTNAGNMNRWTNANITREEYDRNRADYDADRGDSKIGQGANDSWLWTKTRMALMTTADLRSRTINVDVENDVVTLRGTVENAAQKKRAVEVAKGIDGVKNVRDQLTIAPDDSLTNRMVGGNTNMTNTNANR